MFCSNDQTMLRTRMVTRSKATLPSPKPGETTETFYLRLETWATQTGMFTEAPSSSNDPLKLGAKEHVVGTAADGKATSDTDNETKSPERPWTTPLVAPPAPARVKTPASLYTAIPGGFGSTQALDPLTFDLKRPTAGTTAAGRQGWNSALVQDPFSAYGNGHGQPVIRTATDVEASRDGTTTVSKTGLSA